MDNLIGANLMEEDKYLFPLLLPLLHEPLETVYSFLRHVIEALGSEQNNKSLSSRNIYFSRRKWVVNKIHSLDGVQKHGEKLIRERS